MEPDTEAAEVVQLIFQLSVNGVNATNISRELFHRGIPTPAEYKAAHGAHTHDISRTNGVWPTSTILRILSDERYIGTYVIGKRAVMEVGGNRSRMKDRDKWFIIPDHHPAIVDPTAFEQSKAKQLRYPQPVKKPRDYPLKGKIFCGCCNHALSRTFQKTSYYFCRHTEADENQPCHRMRFEASGLEQAVLDTLKKQMEVFLSQDGAVSPMGIITEHPAYEQQIEILVNEKMRLYESYQLGEIELSAYKTRKENLDAKLLKAKNAYAALTAQAKRDQEAQARKAERQSISKELTAADTLTSELTNLLIGKVYVFPDKCIEIVYKVKDFIA